MNCNKVWAKLEERCLIRWLPRVLHQHCCTSQWICWAYESRQRQEVRRDTVRHVGPQTEARIVLISSGMNVPMSLFVMTIIASQWITGKTDTREGVFLRNPIMYGKTVWGGAGASDGRFLLHHSGCRHYRLGKLRWQSHVLAKALIRRSPSVASWDLECALSRRMAVCNYPRIAPTETDQIANQTVIDT